MLKPLQSHRFTEAETALTTIDWLVVIAYLAVTVGISLAYARRAGEGTAEFFLAGRSLPWWLLGTSMVATTFSTDTPNLVAEIVRADGLAGNWVWWAFLLTGMLTVFVFAPLWRRSGLLTDLEFYEIRYSGRPAAFLRGFRAVYLGVMFNVIIMATVMLAAAKIGGALFGASKGTSIAVCAVIALGYAVVAGFWGVVVTDLLQFALSLTGAVVAAVYALTHPAVGGLGGLIGQLGDRLDIVPPTYSEAFVALLVVPLALQWWSVWYPGSEPGGGATSFRGCSPRRTSTMRCGEHSGSTSLTTRSAPGRGSWWRSARSSCIGRNLFVILIIFLLEMVS